MFELRLATVLLGAAVKVGDPAGDRLQWIIIALVGLAVVIGLANIWLWRRTRPARRDGISVEAVDQSG